MNISKGGVQVLAMALVAKLAVALAAALALALLGQD
jgi:hypothetical protein